MSPNKNWHLLNRKLHSLVLTIASYKFDEELCPGRSLVVERIICRFGQLDEPMFLKLLFLDNLLQHEANRQVLTACNYQLALS